ncbi:MAG: hypothetical protein M3352_06430 [Bacteroidota bacterium]|nr:hypothetical protein [Bacteroidota bacterium]
MKELIIEYKELLNTRLPVKYTYPVKYNHCFNRIILDWLFTDCWYNHLDRRKSAISQLDETQLKAVIYRMNQWLADQQLLIADNKNSLFYRSKTAQAFDQNMVSI